MDSVKYGLGSRGMPASPLGFHVPPIPLADLSTRQFLKVELNIQNVLRFYDTVATDELIDPPIRPAVLTHILASTGC